MFAPISDIGGRDLHLHRRQFRREPAPANLTLNLGRLAKAQVIEHPLGSRLSDERLHDLGIHSGSQSEAVVLSHLVALIVEDHPTFGPDYRHARNPPYAVGVGESPLCRIPRDASETEGLSRGRSSNSDSRQHGASPVRIAVSPGRQHQPQLGGDPRGLIGGPEKLPQPSLTGRR